MASRVDFAVSATPVHTHTTGEGQANTDSIAADVGKSLGGSGSIAHTWGSTVGYGSGNATLVAAGTNYAVGQTAVTLGTFTSANFVFIKHSGFLSNGTTVSNVDVKITMAATIADATTVAVLGPGEAIILPYGSDTVTPTLWAAGNGEAVGVEVMGAIA